MSIMVGSMATDRHVAEAETTENLHLIHKQEKGEEEGVDQWTERERERELVLCQLDTN